MDEPFFHYVYDTNEPHILLFTNPATAAGTMRRLNDYATSQGKSISHIEAHVIENTFELIMQGKQEQYVEEVSKVIKEVIMLETKKKISIAQLSMVEAAEKVERELRVSVGNPLRLLVESMGK